MNARIYSALGRIVRDQGIQARLRECGLIALINCDLGLTDNEEEKLWEIMSALENADEGTRAAFDHIVLRGDDLIR